MEPSWHSRADQFANGDDRNPFAGKTQLRTNGNAVGASLGELYERSTSAPPPSSTEDAQKWSPHRDDSLVGNVSNPSVIMSMVQEEVRHKRLF